MKMRDAIVRAVRERNAFMAGRIVDRLRTDRGFNYTQIQTLFSEWSGCTASDFEALMYQADTLDSECHLCARPELRGKRAGWCSVCGRDLGFPATNSVGGNDDDDDADGDDDNTESLSEIEGERPSR